MKNAKILNRKTVYASDWLSIHLDCVEYPAGRISEEHHCVDFQYQGVGAIITDSKNRVLLIKSYRYIVDTVDWEIPAGGFKNEDVIAAARREVLEETGYECTDYQKIYSYYPLTGISNSRFHLVSCKAAQQVSDFDANEVHSVQWFKKDEIKKLIAENAIQDGFSLQGLCFYLMNHRP